MFLKTNKVESSTSAGIASAAAKKGVPSIISGDLHILGNLVSDGTIDVDGSVEGNIKAEQVTIRANGKVTGDLVAECVHVYGEVRGLIRAHSVHLYSSCHIEGVIMHQSLTVEDGAFIDGKFKRLQGKSPFADETPADDEEGDGGLLVDSSAPLGNLRLIG